MKPSDEIRQCKRCQQEFRPSASAISKGGGLYCSIKCARRTQGERFADWWQAGKKPVYKPR